MSSKTESAVEIYNDDLRCGTFLISEGFERDHFKVLRLIEKYKDRFLRLDNKRLSKSFIIRRVPVQKAGRPTDEIMLNEKQTVFLGTLFRNTERVLDFKEKLANDFIEQREMLKAISTNRQTKEFIENRAAGKIARREETDTIKDFVYYAKLQGSNNADKYYMALSKCVNKNLFEFDGKFKNVRDVMTANQLIDVKFADKVVSRGLSEGMEKGLPYKEIYNLVKARLISLAELCGKSEIISKNLMIE